jgi:trehalose 6-phosphate phosphatase
MGNAGHVQVTRQAEPGREASAPPADFDASKTAFFFDFDGTLADIVADPAAAAIDRTTLSDLDKLWRLSGGALAIVSGRGAAELDRFLHPLRLPLGAVHGLERRTADGRLHRAEVDPQALEALGARVREFAVRTGGLVLEFKSAAVALHYRQAPSLGEDVLRFARDVEAEMPAVHLLPGKMVAELKLGSRTKADAIAAFLQEAPFAGRRPVFAGDDLTDEDGFRAVDAAGGISVKVGPGPTRAAFRLEGPPALRDWLARVSTGLERGAAGSQA